MRELASATHRGLMSRDEELGVSPTPLMGPERIRPVNLLAGYPSPYFSAFFRGLALLVSLRPRR